MKKKLLALVLTVAMTVIGALGVKQVTVGPSTFDRLLALAVAADTAYDLEDEWKPSNGTEFHNLTVAILYQFVEEGFIGNPQMPRFASYEYGIYRSSIAGTYSPEQNIVGLNVRYFTDPSWMSHDWMTTLVHELVHAQGFHNEAQTETLAQETVAAMANLGFPGMRKALLDNIRRDALGAAYFIARYGGEFTSDTTNAGGIFTIITTGGTVDQGLLDKVMAARAAVYTPEELRRSDARLRYWTTGERARTYPAVLDAYVVRPMAGTTEAACREGNLLGQKYLRIVRDIGREVGPYKLDDFAYALKELGWSC